MIKKIVLLLVIVFFVSCNSSRSVVHTHKKKVEHSGSKTKITTKTSSKTPAEDDDKQVQLEATSNVKTYEEEIKLYISNFQEIAKNNMKEHGIPASITLAQGILESGAGKGKLAQSANNHFGIKCHTGWTGESVKHDDDAAQECFRKYTHPSESYRDHSYFLTSRSRYNSLFKLDKDDYVAWAKGLKTAGYATDVKYPDKLISLIKRFELYKFDSEVLKNNNISPKKESKIEIPGGLYTIQQGDTLYSISKKFNLSVKRIKKLNNLSENGINVGQKIKIK